MNDEILAKRLDRINSLLDSLAGFQNCACYVLNYQCSLSELNIAVHDPSVDPDEPSFYLSFSPTHYFDGPMSWTGADFRLATDDDWEEVLLRIPHEVSSGLVDEFSEFIKHRFFLFVLEKPNCRVRILSARCTKITGAIASPYRGRQQ